MRYFNTTSETWQSDPYMVKEHSVAIPRRFGSWLATVVVVPLMKAKVKNPDEETTSFVPMGVRIEDVSTRVVSDGYVLPGMTYFFSFSREKISSADPCRFVRNRASGLEMSGMDSPLVEMGEKVPGVVAEAHRFGADILLAVEMARASYDAWREEKRAAA